jgi:hypothetical protein
VNKYESNPLHADLAELGSMFSGECKSVVLCRVLVGLSNHPNLLERINAYDLKDVWHFCCNDAKSFVMGVI